MQENLQNEADEISLKELIQKIQNAWKFLLTKWLFIFLMGISGGVFGYVYAYFQPIKYSAKLTFVVEEGKSGGGGLASLAGQFGFDLGGSSVGGVFSGDNILLFLKSESLCREILTTTYPGANHIMLVDKYAEVTKLKRGWENNKKVGKIIFSKYPNGKFPRLEDSLMQEITKQIIKEDLFVTKPDKKASFIEVKALMQDELLSKLFSERLVKIATDKYVDSKTKVKILNLMTLQKRADSLSVLLNSKTFSAAASQQNLVDVNPALHSAPIHAEISARDKTMAATIFGEVVKNLEISKTMLSQETPVIQMVDQSTIPLEQKKIDKLLALVLGGMLAGFLACIFLLGRRGLSSLL